MSYLKDREIWLSSVPTGNPPGDIELINGSINII
jgi:hypothetical protein